MSLDRRWHLSLVACVALAMVCVLLGEASYLLATERQVPALSYLGLLFASSGLAGMSILVCVVLAMRVGGSVQTILLVILATIFYVSNLLLTFGKFHYSDFYPPWVLFGAFLTSFVVRVFSSFSNSRSTLDGPQSSVLGQSNASSIWLGLLFWAVITVIGIQSIEFSGPRLFFDNVDPSTRTLAAAVMQIVFGVLAAGFGLAQLRLCQFPTNPIVMSVRTLAAGIGTILGCVICFIVADFVWTPFTFLVAAIGSISMQLIIPSFLYRWRWRWSRQSDWIPKQFDDAFPFSLIQRRRRLIARGGWPCVCGIMIVAILVRIILSTAILDGGAMSLFSETFPFFMSVIVAIYLACLVSIALIVCVLGKGLLRNVLVVFGVWCLVDITAIAFLPHHPRQWISVLQILLLCIPTVGIIFSSLVMSAARRRWIGPTKSFSRSKFAIRDLMIITGLVGIELALLQVSRQYILVTVFVGILMFVTIVVGLAVIRWQFGFISISGIGFAIFLSVAVVIAEMARTFMADELEIGMILITAICAGTLVLATFYFVVGWLEQNEWRRFDSENEIIAGVPA